MNSSLAQWKRRYRVEVMARSGYHVPPKAVKAVGMTYDDINRIRRDAGHRSPPVDERTPFVQKDVYACMKKTTERPGYKILHLDGFMKYESFGKWTASLGRPYEHPKHVVMFSDGNARRTMKTYPGILKIHEVFGDDVKKRLHCSNWISAEHDAVMISVRVKEYVF
nr:hypothetical protein TetV2_00371 [Oceanusvirus sp.]